MVLFNYSTKELTAKIVYYGPGLCGKTTNLQFIHGNLPDNVKGKMLSLATKTDRTLFFDFLPLDLGNIRGMKTRVQLYTVPGQVFYNETRKLVLKGADGIVFVADSQEQMMGANVESFRNLEENLKAHGMKLSEMPHVIQFNKRDLPRLSSIEDMNASINKYNAPFYESVATTGIGVQDTLKAVAKLVLLHLTKKYDPKFTAADKGAAAPKAKQPPAPPMAATPPVSIPLSDPGELDLPAEVTQTDLTAEAAQTGIPVSPMDAPTEEPVQAEAPEPVEKTSPPPPPDFGIGAPPDDPLQELGDQDIDDLVGEVEDQSTDLIQDPAAAMPEEEPSSSLQDMQEQPEPEPDEVPEWTLEEQEAAVEEEPATVAIPPLEGEEQPAGEPTISLEEEPLPVAAAGEEDAPGMEEPSLEIDRDFDPEWAEEEPGGSPASSWGAVDAGAGLQVSGDSEPVVPPPFPPPVDVFGQDFEETSLEEPLEMDSEPASGEELVSPPFPGSEDAFEPATVEQEASEEEPFEVETMTEDPEPVPLETVQESVEEVPVLLTEVADDDQSLFEDPSLDVASMAEGEATEIIVPVQLGEGKELRRFKLSITLKLDPVD